MYSPTEETCDARLTMTWTLFDGLAREDSLAKAHADQKQAAAAVDSFRNQVDNQLWSAYSTTRTAPGQQRAAAALLGAATESYNAPWSRTTMGRSLTVISSLMMGKPPS
jgi:outer membrane protein TolC